MIVVAIIGLLAALAIYGVRKYMTNSKTAEARQALGAMSKGARAAYDGEVWDDTTVIAAGQINERASSDRNSATSAGSNCTPDSRSISASAASSGHACL